MGTTGSACSCPTPGSNGCPDQCTKRTMWTCKTPGYGACASWCAQRCATSCCQSSAWLKDKLESIGHVNQTQGHQYRVPRVMVWQGERNEDGHLAFMYWPVMSTLVQGFRHAAVELVAGAGLTREYKRQLARLRPGDIFVWVGLNERLSQPWSGLGQRRVKRIYYQTEPTPRHDCTHLTRPYKIEVEEVWEFSHHNIEGCAKQTGAPKFRFVPPGFLPPPRRSSPLPDRTAPSSALVFFGSLERWSGRWRCFEALKGQMGEALQQTYSVWNESALSAFLHRHDFFLNLHKGCERGHAPVTFRHALLLSAAKLVVSERCHPLDEDAYKGLITFAPQQEMASIHSSWAKLPRQEVVARQQSIAAGFRRRFAPQRIFENAGIYKELHLQPNRVVV